jgi:hypothetical protein
MGNQCSGSSGRRKFLIGGGVLEADTKRLVEIEKPIVAQGILQLLLNTDDFLDSFCVQKFRKG